MDRCELLGPPGGKNHHASTMCIEWADTGECRHSKHGSGHGQFTILQPPWSLHNFEDVRTLSGHC